MEETQNDNDKWCLKEAHHNLCRAYLIYWANFGLKIDYKVSFPGPMLPK